MIYIATHKKFNMPTLRDSQGYVPLHVGAVGKNSLGYTGDDTGDNISLKNPHYCELTGLYWIWKNTEDEYKGLVHYRRYFGKNNLTSNPSKIYTYDELVTMLSKYDIVLPYIEYFKQTAKEEILIECCTEEIFDKLRRSVQRLYPEYIEDFDDFFSQNKCYLFNMMFCRRELFDKYSKWLFDILFDLEPKIDLKNLNAYQQRLYGFLSERLLNVWVRHNNLKIKHLPVVNLEMGLKEKILLILRRVKHKYVN